jgi:heme exporter protein A
MTTIAMDNAMTLSAQHVACIRGERELFGDVNLCVQGGDALRIAGTNGSGKSSLLRILCGLSLPHHGRVCWNGEDISRLREQFCGQLIYLGHANGVKDDLLAWENLVFAGALANMAISRDSAYAALDRLGLGAAADLPTRSLSQGQRKRVALARLQMGAAQALWILDEPFTALDQAAVDQLIVTINAHLARGGMVVYTTHQEITLQAARMLCIDLSQNSSQNWGKRPPFSTRLSQTAPC